MSYAFGQLASQRDSSPPGRALHEDEIELGREAFTRAFGSDEGFDYSAVRVINGKFVPWQPSNVAIAPDGNIYYPSDCGNLAVCGGESIAALFVHELTHAWQYQQGDRVFLRGLGLQAAHYVTFGRYDPYALPRQYVPYNQLNLEQQAQYVTRTLFPNYVWYKND
jgi:hypothetical protein